jgi:hypothetical protein
MKICWDSNTDKRPEMDEVVTMLEAIDTSNGGGMIPLDQKQSFSEMFVTRYSGKSVYVLFHWRKNGEEKKT